MLNYIAPDSIVQIVFLFVVLGLVIAIGTIRSATVHKRLQMMENNADRKWRTESELIKFQHGALEHKPPPSKHDD